ncbi:Vps62-related protein [Mechercharimyces sp. CAU 1602]|uniref:Vps62-related protein n=1 Tax=Mechercharimyces sp. CAU 1602 TaxID=2973933 RepID=UPI002162A041|nr:Vps62-related protein [Mechercharimyces sp. CAU 1602]MCS1350716.1 Vps62-related protein [Mechercharimyces sp. CAU 1602]
MKKGFLMALCVALLGVIFPLGSGANSVQAMTEETSSDYTKDEKLELIKKYAPQVWFDKDEKYFPSSVEWSFDYLERYQRAGSNKYSLRSKQPLNDPNGTLDFFRGDLDSARIYVGWREAGPSTIDLKYMIWYPYNRGKVPSNLETLMNFLPSWLVPRGAGFGHHVGDWEGIEIRLVDGDAKQVKLNYHSFNTKQNWSDFEKVDDTHIVTYSAQGSHGMWKEPGNHEYINLFIDKLEDKTSKGTAWDTWEAVEAYDFDRKESLSGRDWPAWLSADTTSTVAGMDSADPASGGIDRWGNEEGGCSLQFVCVLNNGPGGPDENTNWTSTFGEPATSIFNVAFRSHHGKYLVAEGDGDKNVNANRSQVGNWERFNLKVTNSVQDDGSGCVKDGDLVNIETGSGYYLRATDNGSLDAKANKPQSWEEFQLTNHSNANGCLKSGDQISLKSRHGKYVVAENNGDANANRSKIGSWEKFIIEFH